MKSNASSSSSSLSESASSSNKWASFNIFSKSQSPSVEVASASSASGSPQLGQRAEGSSTPQQTPFLDDFELFFGRYFSEIAKFSFDKGKEIADKERAVKHQHGPSWTIITTSLAQIAQMERAYLNLTFLAPKGFLRKDSNLKSTLESVKSELRKISEANGGSIGSKKLSHFEVARGILVLVTYRLDMMEFYEKLSLYGTAKNVEISDLITDIDGIIEKFSDHQNSVGESLSILNGFINSLNWEGQIMSNLLKLIYALQTWQYMEATVAVQQTTTALTEWNELVQINSVSVKKPSFYSSAPTLPILFLWIKKLKGILISKYTLYFYELLAKHSTPTFDIKFYSTKLPVDFHNRLSTFQKKADAVCVSIVFDSRGTLYYKNGYKFPGLIVEPLEGLDSFPSILSIPTKPIQYWPSIVMIISGKLSELNANKIVVIFDPGVQMTYFIQKIDTRMYFIIMYEGKRPEKDAFTLKFLSELTTDLNGARAFSNLKSFKQ